MSDFQHSGSSAKADVESLTLLGIISLVRKHLLLALVPVVLSPILAVGYSLTLPDIYEARLLLTLEIPPSAAFNPMMTVRSQLAAIRETIDRRAIVEPVILEHGLYEATEGRVNQHWLDTMRSRVQIEVGGPQTFHIVFKDQDPELAAEVVTRIGDLFIEQTETSQRSSTQQQVELLAAQVADAAAQLEQHRRRIDEYKASAGGRIPESIDVLLSDLRQANSRLQDTERLIRDEEAKRTVRQTELDALGALGFDRQMASPALQNAERIALQEQVAALLRSGHTEAHPDIIDLRSKIDRLSAEASTNTSQASPQATSLMPQQSRYITVHAELQGIDSTLASLEQERQRWSRTIEDYERSLEAMPEYTQELSLLTDELRAAQTSYRELSDRHEKARLDARLQPSGGPLGFSILEAARVPQGKVEPSRRRYAAMGVMLGLFMAAGIVLLRHQLDDTFSDIDDLRRFAGISTLAAIPSFQRRGFRGRRQPRLPCLAHEATIESEQYRIFTARLRHMMDREGSQALLITSPGGCEGKTTTAVNTALALSMMQEGRVLLVDGDLRKPRVREYLTPFVDGRLGPQDGLRHLLSSSNGLTPEYFGRVGRLFVLASGDPSSDSLCDISADSVRKVLARLRKEFKYIVIDAPPLLPAVDAHLLADLVDRVVLVVRARHTRRDTLARTLQSFDLSHVMGFVLNDVNYAHGRYADAYRYYAKEYLPGKARATGGVKVRVK